MMSLNLYRIEARDFLEKMNALNGGTEQKIKWLEDEFQLLKDAVKLDETDKIRHQIYDMLFLLFEISADYNFDLDDEWSIGRERKRQKYLNCQSKHN